MFSILNSFSKFAENYLRVNYNCDREQYCYSTAINISKLNEIMATLLSCLKTRNNYFAGLQLSTTLSRTYSEFQISTTRKKSSHLNNGTCSTMLLLCALFSLFPNLVLTVKERGSPPVIQIGGIFDETEDHLESVFRHATDAVNTKHRTDILRLSAEPKRIKAQDSFHAAKAVCDLIEDDVWALFGPQVPAVGWLVRSCAHHLHIPHLLISWDYRTPKSLFKRNINQSDFTLNLYPDPSSLSKAFMDLVIQRDWKEFTLIYEENEGLIKLKDLLRISTVKEKVKMTIRQHHSSQSYKKLFKNAKRHAEKNFVLSVALDKVQEILRQAQQNGLLTEYYQYLIASLDAHTLDLSEFQLTDRKVNILALTMLDPDGQQVPHSTRDFLSETPNVKEIRPLELQTALLYDSVDLFAKAIQHLYSKQTVFKPSMSCESKDQWAFGESLINFMKTETTKGLTGPIQFDDYGQRTNITLDIISLENGKFDKVFCEKKCLRRLNAECCPQKGIWNNSGVHWKSNDTGSEQGLSMLNITFKVGTYVNPPYVMYREDHEKYEGIDKYEGYCIDILRAMSDYKFEIIENKESSNGKLLNGTWNGLMGMLLNNEVDLAISDLTITQERRSYVDFTMPFMNLGISILIKKQDPPPTDYFSFLAPFSLEVWLYVLTAFLGVSLLMYITSRITPYEWVSGHPCDPEPEELENQFSLGNCLWFTLGSIMQQGSDLAPRALSTRALASVWGFFTLIMVSSYTANLAAVLTVSRMETPIATADDLVKQTKIAYGCYEGLSTCKFFQKSNHSTYQRMWSYMESARPSVFVKSNDDGIERTLKGNYAYLMESSSIEYNVEKYCDLTQVGGLLDQKGYGIAFPPNSPYRATFSNLVIGLQESGKLDELKKLWWVDKVKPKGGVKCVHAKKADAVSALKIGDVGGVFLVLLAGTGIGCLLVILEFVWKTKKVARHQRDHAASMLYDEIKRVCKVQGGTRELHRQKSSSDSVDSLGNESASRNNNLNEKYRQSLIGASKIDSADD